MKSIACRTMGSFTTRTWPALVVMVVIAAHASLRFVGSSGAAEPADVNYDEGNVPSYSLPPLFAAADQGHDRLAVWRNARRGEVLSLFEEHVYGKTPATGYQLRADQVERSDHALGGTAIRRQFVLHVSPRANNGQRDTEHALRVEVLIYTPQKTNGLAPAFVGLNSFGNQTVHEDPTIRMSRAWMRQRDNVGIIGNRATEASRGVHQQRWQLEQLIARGYGLVTAYYGDIDPDTYQADFTDGVHPLFYEPGQTAPAENQWGAIGAWAWGLSTIRQWLEADELINVNRLAVVGHSRLGKTALWAGARDERFAMVISNNSGCGGAALYRRCFGERIHHMVDNRIAYWFCRRHATYALREHELPVDQHMLLALIAPRPLYIASAVEDQWADPRGEFLAARGAAEIYELYGTAGLPADEFPPPDQPRVGRIGYHVRTGKHEVTEYDWEQYLDFADRFL